MTLLAPPPPGDLRLLFLSPVLLALAFPPFHLVFPSFLGLVPLALWLARLPRSRRGRGRAFRGGFWAGLLFHGLHFHWVLLALGPRTAFALPAYLFLVLVSAGLWAGVAGGTWEARRLGMPLWLALPVFWTAMEWLRAHLGDLSFPWMQLGDSLTGWPRLIGAADLVGSRGLSFWMALVSGLVATALAPGPESRRLRWRPLVAAALTAVIPVLYSLDRWHDLSTTRVARAAVLQPDLPMEVKAEPSMAVERTVRWTEALLAGGALSRRDSVDVVVFPETAFPVMPDTVDGGVGRPPTSLTGWIDRTARRVGAPVLFGALGAGEAADGGPRFNAVFYRSPGVDGPGRYAKRRLVPGFERVPFLEGTGVPPWLPGGGRREGRGFSPGEGAPLFRAGGSRFGVLVCYESLFADLSRDYRRRGADFVVNVSNDGWFGDESPAWMRTAALWQHPAHLVMRAVENRMGVVRAANRGLSGVVDPRGRWTTVTPLFRATHRSAGVRAATSLPLYSRIGDLVGLLSALAAAGVTLASTAPWIRRSSGGNAEGPTVISGAREER